MFAIVFSAGTAHSQTGATDSSSCASHLNTAPVEEVSIGALLNCVAEMQRDIEELKDSQGVDEADILNVVRNETHGIETGVTEEEVRDMLAGQGIPNRIVVASTVECGELGQGWQPFREATGRFLVERAPRPCAPTAHGTGSILAAGSNPCS